MQSQPAYNDFNQCRTILDRNLASLVTVERTSAFEEEKQSLHESIDSIPDDRSTIRHSIYNKHQTCTAVCRQVVHESKCIIISDIEALKR